MWLHVSKEAFCCGGNIGGKLLGTQLNHWVSALRRRLGTQRPFVCSWKETLKAEIPLSFFLLSYPLLSPFLFPTALFYLQLLTSSFFSIYSLNSHPVYQRHGHGSILWRPLVVHCKEQDTALAGLARPIECLPVD